MNTKHIFPIIYLVGILAVAVISYLKGRNDVWVAEFKTYDGDLITLNLYEGRHSDDLREFMKGRYYYLANKIPESWLGSPYDYGVVSTNVAHLGIGKGPTSPQNEYELFKQKKVKFRSP